MRSPIIWFGGKGFLITKLLKYVPPHKYYLEAFGGGASLLFAKVPVEFEVYNDVDEGLVALFRVLRDKEKFEEFYRKVCLTPYARAEYDYCRETWDKVEDEVERAYRFFVTVRMSFGGTFGSGWGYEVRTISKEAVSTVSRWLSLIEELPLLYARIMRVQIECIDGIACIRKYTPEWGYEKGFCYLDPPYVLSARRRGEYRYEVDEEYHKSLVETLLELQDKCKFMLSGYENEIYERLEKAGWRKVCWDVPCFVAGRTRFTGLRGEGVTFEKGQRRKECIWMNYGVGLGIRIHWGSGGSGYNDSKKRGG